MVALPKSHALAGKRSIALKQLAGESFVAFSREKVPAAHAQLISACTEAGFYPDIEQECSQVGGVICLMAAGLPVPRVPSNRAPPSHPQGTYASEKLGAGHETFVPVCSRGAPNN